MRVLVVGHSLAHVRQQKFFRRLAILGNDVLLCCPSEWGQLKPEPEKLGYSQETFSTFEVLPLEAMGAPDMYHFFLPDLGKAVRQWKPDLVYIQQEIACHLTRAAWPIAKDLQAATAIFVWENLKPLSVTELQFLQGFDRVICGNGEAARLHPHPRQALLPQVGVDMEHFAARPGIERATSVGYIGRPVAEKGVHDLEAAWPMARITPWMDWTKLPWALSGVRVIVCPSRDTPSWHEQAMPYAAVEAMACGCAVVVSDAGAIPWWLKGGFCEPCEAVVMVRQADPADLRRGIAEALDTWEARGKAGRTWVSEHLGANVIAKRLSNIFAEVVHG